MMSALRLSLLRVLAAYVRRVPDHPGQWRIVQLAVAWAPLLRSLGRPVVVRLKDGSRLLVDGTSQTGRIAFATGSYEPRTTALIRASVRPGDTVVDVGANIGYFSIVAARAVGAAGRVLAFEPVPAVRHALMENLGLNGVGAVEVRDEALSRQSGEVSFFVGPAQDTGLGSLRALQHGTQIRVQQRRFDDIFDRQSRVALVKIDVEGGELGVLQGMEECLRRDRPEIVLEVTDEFLRALGASAEQLHRFLSDLGYYMWMIPEEGPLAPVRTAADVANCPSQFNAFCSADGANDAVSHGGE